MDFGQTPVLNISLGREWLRDADNSNSDAKLADSIAMENFLVLPFLTPTGVRAGDCLLVETATGDPSEAARHW